MAAGSGAPPVNRRPRSASGGSPAGSSIGAPHFRQIGPFGLVATGPSSASWSAPTGSKFVV
jgi:hypothetical protein